MSHDLHASLAASEIALVARDHSEHFFTRPVAPGSLSCYAVREGRSAWPIPDGVVTLENAPARKTFNVAIEFKRTNEGLHGTLTALGQAHAYLHKGFAGSVIVIPESYETHDNPGDHIKSIVDTNSASLPIGIVTYQPPDPTQSRPFADRIRFVRPLNLGDSPPSSSGHLGKASSTQWVHIRSGAWSPHMVFSYLKIANELALVRDVDVRPKLPRPLIVAAQQIAPTIPPAILLSASPAGSSSFHDRVWRHFWFRCVFHKNNWNIWTSKNGGVYKCNMSPTRILNTDGSPSVLFCGRNDSIRRKLVEALNAGSICEADAWKEYAAHIGGSRLPGATNRGRAHSYREDIDSLIGGLEFIDAQGYPTPLGHRFLTECIRSDAPSAGTAKMLFGAALLRNGNFGALAHFIYRLSEKRFADDPLAFSALDARGNLAINRVDYTEWLWKSLSEDMGVLRTTSSRSGGTRGKLLDEVAAMKFFGFVSEGYRVAVGLPLNWSAIQQSLDFPID
jgi:hypothetical protein